MVYGRHIAILRALTMSAGTMSAGLIVAKSRIHGVGVFATRRFAADEKVLRLDDSRVVDLEHPLLPGEHSYHCDYLGADKVVLMPSPERHINSSCDPNVYVRTSGGTPGGLRLSSDDAHSER